MKSKKEHNTHSVEKKKLILASGSPRRKELLKQLGLSFRIVISGVQEKLNPRLSPRRQAEEISLQKALAVARKTSSGIILSADTIVVVDEQILGKPIDFRETKRFLKRLHGREHSVITGFTLLDIETKKRVTKSEETIVTMKRLSQGEIDSYIIKEETTDKAGGYAIQGIGSVLFEKISGDYFNVMGLPVHSVANELKKFGIYVL